MTAPKPGPNGIAQLLGVATGVVALVLVGQSMASSLEREIAYERKMTAQLISSQQSRIDTLESQVHSHERGDTSKWSEVSTTSSSTQQRFVEVETQFNDLERRIRDLEEWQLAWYSRFPTSDATQDQKIATLEWKVFGATIGEQRVKEVMP